MKARLIEFCHFLNANHVFHNGSNGQLGLQAGVNKAPLASVLPLTRESSSCLSLKRDGFWRTASRIQVRRLDVSSSVCMTEANMLETTTTTEGLRVEVLLLNMPQ